MSDFISLLVLYDRPSDAPGLWVVREQRTFASGEILTAPIAFLFTSETRACKWLESGGRVRLHRYPKDAPHIVGAWI